MKKWFEENFEIDKGRTIKIEIKNLLYSYKSKFQFIEIYDTIPFGKMLVTDGIIMLTQYDNYAYHEMITHVPMTIHNNPKKVFIVGGGDGGTLTEILKYDCIEEIIICEIDKEIIKICREFFPEFSDSWDDPRVKIIIDDAKDFVSLQPDNYFDIVIVDSSDPINIAIPLFENKFYKDIHRVLSNKGIVSSQMESLYYHLDFISDKVYMCKNIFRNVYYYFTLVPTYPSGIIGFILGLKGDDNIIPKVCIDYDLKYYTESIHKSSFVLPKFAEFLNEKHFRSFK